ncbi:transglycosylase domain-containing protein [Thermaerobacter subterraneus]|uniref:Penicillin-binding protein 1A n=1 Tax=Thermaerobacter subterraneus DSM 13965 TaxID=867903 RepID=K6PM74_9FIRM|nr:PBP1A family penicillin-binding protein [Thermaerobacter subterraneus]EKP93972.1 penicillin-binding protein, 1A family [Thermaerobacter subterraneus DSM 13965]
MAGYPHAPAGGGPRRRKPWWRRIRWMRLFLFLVFLFGISGTVLAAGFMMGAVRAMGPITALRPQVAQTSFIYDRHGELLTEITGPENRIVVPLEQIPEHVRQAFIAIEDERFYDHFGVDPIGIARALINNLRGGYLQGASTITQQLARSAFLTQDRTWRRKVQEAILAIELERRFTKDEILEMYLNQIYFGNGAYGIQAASYTYFGKPVEELTIAEAAVLAGIPKNPSAYPPPPIPEPGDEPSPEDQQRAENGRWKERQRLVLTKMRELGFITEEQYRAALEEDVLGNRPKTAPNNPQRDQNVFGHVVDYVIEETQRILAEQLAATRGLSPSEAQQRAESMLYQGGLRIYSTVDPELQRAAYRAQHEHLRRLGYPMPTPEDRLRGPQAAAVLIDVEQAQVVALVGGRFYDGPLGARNFNRATTARRSLGSATKPLTAYGPALAAGYTPATAVDDVIQVVPSGGSTKPIGNYDDRYFGFTPFRFGLKRSINTVAIQAVQLVGVDQAWEFGRRLGLNLVEKDRDISPLALGGFTNGVTPLEVADAYATLARGGVREPAYIVSEIRDAQGRVLYRHQSHKEAVVDEKVAYLLADMMRDVMEPHRFPAGIPLYQPSSGTGYSVHNNYFRRPAAGKTGTHQDRDVWFVGFTPQYAAAVWVGYDEYNDKVRSLPRGASGAGVPGPIWGRIMAAAHEGKPVRWFDPPRGIVTATVCANTGLLPGPNCPEEFQYREVFIAGTQPSEAENLWVKMPVCAENPEFLYAPNCACTPQEKAFFNRPLANLPENAPEPKDYALMPPDPEKASCAASPVFQRDRGPNEIWLTPQGAVPGEMAVTGAPGATVTVRLTDVAGRDHQVSVPLPDRQIQVGALQSVEVPLTLPAEPGQQEYRITATSTAPDGGKTTLVVRLLVTVQGAAPGQGGGNGGDGGNGGGRGDQGATVTVRLLGDAGATGPAAPVQVRAGQPLELTIEDGIGQDHNNVVIMVDGQPMPPVKVRANRSTTLTFTFDHPAQHRIDISHLPNHPAEDVTIVVEVVAAEGGGSEGGEDGSEGGQAILPIGPGVFRVDWDRWWAALTGRAA